MSRCKHCRAEIRWTHTPSGAAMPLDPNPNEDGNILIVNEPHPVAHVLGPLEAAAAAAVDEPLYMTHFATCPKWPSK